MARAGVAVATGSIGQLVATLGTTEATRDATEEALQSFSTVGSLAGVITTARALLKAFSEEKRHSKINNVERQVKGHGNRICCA